MRFKDHFSRQATDYAKFRPQYPRALFDFVGANSPNNEVALDCATGNGQAAVGLAEFFQRVIALDASAEQIGVLSLTNGWNTVSLLLRPPVCRPARSPRLRSRRHFTGSTWIASTEKPGGS
jgi:hypothetical protein